MRWPLIKFARKSVRQTFWIGMGSAIAAVIWLFGSVAADPSMTTHTFEWVGLVPAALLWLIAAGFFGRVGDV